MPRTKEIQKFAIYAEAKGYWRPLIMTHLPFARLIDDIVYPYENNESFMIDGAPLKRDLITKFKILRLLDDFPEHWDRGAVPSARRGPPPPLLRRCHGPIAQILSPGYSAPDARLRAKTGRIDPNRRHRLCPVSQALGQRHAVNEGTGGSALGSDQFKGLVHHAAHLLRSPG